MVSAYRSLKEYLSPTSARSARSGLRAREQRRCRRAHSTLRGMSRRQSAPNARPSNHRDAARIRQHMALEGTSASRVPPVGHRVADKAAGLEARTDRDPEMDTVDTPEVVVAARAVQDTRILADHTDTAAAGSAAVAADTWAAAGREVGRAAVADTPVGPAGAQMSGHHERGRPDSEGTCGRP